MDNLGILIQAILSLKDTTDSKKQIAKELPKLESQLQSDKNTRIKIVAGLDIAKSKNLIQAQLNTLANQAKAPTIKVGIDTSDVQSVKNLTNGLKEIQAQAQQTAKSVNQVVTSLKSQDVSNDSISSFQKYFNIIGEDAKKTQQVFKDLFAELNNSWYAGDTEKYADTLNRIYSVASKTTTEIANSRFELKELTSQIRSDLTDGSKAFINPTIKSDLKKILGDKNEVSRVLSTIYGVGNWTYKKDSGVGADALANEAKEIQGSADDIISAYKKIQSVKSASTISIFDQLGGEQESKKAIEEKIQSLLKLTNVYKDMNGVEHNYIQGLGWFESIGDESEKVNSSLSSIQKEARETSIALGEIGHNFISNNQVQATFDSLEQAEEYFKNLNLGDVSLSLNKGSLQGLTDFTIKIKSATGEVERFRYVVNNIGDDQNPIPEYNLANINASNEAVQRLIQSQQKAQDKLKALRIDLASTLKSIGTGYSDPNSAKPIVDDTHIKNLNTQYVHALRTIAELKNADDITMASMKANAEKEIDSLKRMVREYQNAEYAATSLRTKDIGTIKTNQTNELNAFIAQINNAKIPLDTMTKDVEELKTALNGIGDKDSLTKFLNQFDNAKTKFESVKATYKTLIDSITQLHNLQNSSTLTKNASDPKVIQTKQEITQLLAEYQKLMTQMQGNITPAGLESIGNHLTQLNARFNSAYTSAKKFETELKNDNGAEKLAQKVDLLTSRIKAYQAANSKANKTYGSQFTEMLNQLNNPNIDNEAYNRVAKHFQIIRQEINATGKSGKTFFQTLGDQAKKFASWMTLTGVISTLWREMRKMVTNVIELDDSLLELSKVSELSSIGLQKVTKDAYALGKEVGKTGTQVIDAITNFKRAGFDLQQSTSFAKDALVLTNVAEGINDASEAATALISIMKGYGDTTPEFAQKILDSINQVSNTQAINFDDLVDGSQRLSAVAKQAGASFEQMLGILTGTNEVLQNIEKTSSGEITIFTRLQGIQLPDEEDVMPIAKLQETISTATKGAANIVDQTTGELRNVYDILDDINKVWETLDKNTQEGIAFAAAGTRQKNVFLSMMENWDNVKKSTQSAMDSAGSAIEENQKYLDSISGKLANLESNFQSLSQTIVNSDLIKFIVDSGTKILDTIDNIINSIGTIPTLLSSIAAVGVFKNAGVFKNFSLDVIDLVKNYKTLNTITGEQITKVNDYADALNILKDTNALTTDSITGLYNSIDSLNSDSLTYYFKSIAEGAENARVNIVDAYAAMLDGNTHGLQNIQSIFNTYNDTLKGNVKEQKNFTAAVGQSNITLSKYLATVGTDGKAGLAGYAGYLATATAKTIGLQIATTALNAGISMLVGWGISMLAKGLDEMIVTAEEAAQAAEEARKKAVESAEAYKDESDSLKELQSRYTELISSTNDISTVKDELASIQDELINKYGDEAEAIDVVNGKYAETLALIKEKQLEEAKDYTRTNKANYDKAVNKTQKVEHTDWIKTDNSLRTAIEENAKQFGWLAVAGNYYGDEQPDVYLEDNKFSINGNLQERYDILTKIMESYGKQKDYNIETYNLLVDEASAIKEQLDAYNQIIKQYEEAQKVISNLELPQDTKKEFNELLNKAVEAYNTLNTSNSPAARGEAYEEIKSLETALKNIAGNNTDLQQIVTDTFNSFKLGVDNTNTSLTTLSKTFSDYLDNDFKSATDNISKIQDAIMNIAKGEYIDNADFWELFNLDENGLLGIPTVIDGKFKVSIEKLIALKDEYINKQKEQIALDQEEARLAINNAYKNLSIEERKLNDLRSKVNSPGDIRALKAQEQVVQDIKDSISGYREIISKDNWLIQVLNSNLGYTKEIVDSLTESLQEQVDNLQEQADNLLKAQEHQIDKIVDKLNDEKSVIEDSKKELEEQLKVLEEQKSEIEEIISNYEKVSDIVSETIQGEIDSLEESRQSVEDYYDEMINKLQETNDERQESINLAEKLAALENAKNNKVRVFDETRGWTYEADKSAIESAQEDLLNAQNEAEISRLEKEKKAALADYDAQIKPLQEYEKQWSNK